MRQSHLILSNAAIMCITRVLLVIPQVILVPYLIGTIGEAGYGIYVLVWSLMMSIERLQQSLQSGVVKYSAEFVALEQMDEVNKIVSSSSVYSLLLAVVVCIVSLVAAEFYSDPSGQICTALVVVGVMVLLIFPLTPYTAVIQSMQRYYIGAIAETGSKYISLLAVVIWFHQVGASVDALIIIMMGALFFSRLAQVPFAYRLIPDLKNTLYLLDRKSFKLIAAFGTTTVLASLCLTVNSTGIRWLMATLVSSSFVAHLAIMLMPGLLLSQLVGALTITVMPATSAFEATGNQLLLRELLIRGIRYITIFVLACTFAAVLLISDVFTVWVGTKFDFLVPNTLVLFTSLSFMLSTSIAHHMLKGMGKLRAVVGIYLVGLVIVPISLILLLFHIWHNPYAAVTIGLLIGHLITGFLQLGICMRVVHADILEVFRRGYLQPIIVAVFVCPIVLAVVSYDIFDSLIGQICGSAITVLVFLTCIYVFIATISERQHIRSLIHFALDKITAMRVMFLTRY